MSSALLPRCPTRMSDASFAACNGRGCGGATILPMPPRRVRCGGVFCCSDQASRPWPAVDGPGFGGDFYELLGIRQVASFDEIKQAYKKKVLKYHPDVSPPDCTDQYTQHFIVLKKAYETLSNPVTRAIYDRCLGGLHFNEEKIRRPKGRWRTVELGGLGSFWRLMEGLGEGDRIYKRRLKADGEDHPGIWIGRLMPECFVLWPENLLPSSVRIVVVVWSFLLLYHYNQGVRPITS